MTDDWLLQSQAGGPVPAANANANSMSSTVYNIYLYIRSIHSIFSFPKLVTIIPLCLYTNDCCFDHLLVCCSLVLFSSHSLLSFLILSHAFSLLAESL